MLARLQKSSALLPRLLPTVAPSLAVSSLALTAAPMPAPSFSGLLTGARVFYTNSSSSGSNYGNGNTSSGSSNGPRRPNAGPGGGPRRPLGASRMPQPVSRHPSQQHHGGGGGGYQQQQQQRGSSASQSASFPGVGSREPPRPSAAGGRSGGVANPQLVERDYREMGLDLTQSLPAKKELDIAALFARSRLHSSFEAPPAEESFFADMSAHRPLYFGGTRRLLEPSGRLISSHAIYMVRTVDPGILAMVDTLTTLDYQTSQATQQVTTAIVAADADRAHVVDVNEETGKINSRTMIRLKGEPWKWTSAVSLSQIDRAAMDEAEQPAADADPEDLTVGSVVVARFRFGKANLLAEKFLLANGEKVMGIVDDLKLINEATYDAKVREMFEANLTEEQRMQLEFERNFDENMTPEQIEEKLHEMGMTAPEHEQRGPKKQTWAPRKNKVL